MIHFLHLFMKLIPAIFHYSLKKLVFRAKIIMHQCPVHPGSICYLLGSSIKPPLCKKYPFCSIFDQVLGGTISLRHKCLTKLLNKVTMLPFKKTS